MDFAGINMIYEWRIYEIAAGKMTAIHEHFEKYVIPLFEKHGLKVIGFWTTDIGTSNILYYMLSFKDLGSRDKAWKSMRSDPDHQKETLRFGKEGIVVQRVKNMILEPTSYSPLR
jgi:hypothetical protein